MDFGLAIFPTAESIQPAEVAKLAEERGFESLFFPEHTHIPAARETPYPVGGDLPDEYSRTYDPVVALAVAAAATERLRIGTAICLVVERDPIVTAKEAASLDRLSGGRFVFGVGAGWNLEEMRNHGTEPKARWALLAERIEAIKTIWAEDEASYHGEHVDFERIWCWPKPLQEPHPPVLVAGHGPGVLDRVLAYGDGWLPNPHDREDVHLLERVGELRRRAEEMGRPVSVSLNAASTRPERLERYRDAGFERCIFFLPSAERGEVERRLERIEAARAELG